MEPCQHITGIRNMGKICNAVSTKLSRIKQKKGGVKCSRCREEAGLRVCLMCYSLVCAGHTASHSHPVLFESGRTCVECRECARLYVVEKIMSRARRGVHIKIPSRMYKVINHHPIKGMANLGNTCYMNVVLLVLINSEFFRNEYLSDRHRKIDCGRKECITCSMKSLYEYLYGNGEIMAHKFIYSFWLSTPQFIGSGQHDSHDFLVSLLQRLHEAHSPGTEDDARCRCIAHSMFYGVLRSLMTCAECRAHRCINDPFMSLSLECSSSIASCVASLFKPEALADRLPCRACGRETQWTKETRIARHPKMLCIHLKRFAFDNKPRKIDMDVGLSSTLQIDAVLYDVFGLVSHSGGIDFGHYFAFLRLGDCWYKYDDESVSIIEESGIPSNGSYLVFYANRDHE
jgi:ubiquitin carboxyl-terminal hydrolase 22/27/51